jgi:ribosome biogenesis protein Nip4
MREVLENGEKVTTALYASDGTTVIGYEIKTTTETKGEEKADNTDKATVTETKIVETNKTAPTGYTVGTKETSETDEAGNPVKKTVITEEVTDDDGKVIGYKVTTTTKTTETIEKTEAGADVPTKEETDTVFTLPIKPAESETIDVATQVTTKVTVEEVKNYFGEVIGYKTTTVKTNQEGKELSKETETVYGTTTLIQKTTETKNVTSESTQTKETTVTETKTILGETVTKETTSTDERSFSTETTKVEDSESWKLIETEDGIYFSYKGEMYPVVALENNGKVSTVSLQPDMAGLNPKEGTHNISTMLGNTLTMRNYVPQEGDYNFLYTNDGLESSVQVSYYNSEKKLYGIAMVTQFELTDKDGNKHYVLCADMDTAAHGGQGYSMQNVESADYYQHEGATEHIKAIAYNGYWGTESGIGSLENVKELLRKERAAGKNKLTDTEINSLTDGIALSMTQAALWRYGNASDTKAVDADVLSYGYDIDPYTYQDGGYTYRVDKWAFSDAQKEVMRVLYNTLINLDSTSYTDNTTTLITDKNFANEAVIEIKDKTENNKYNTDISFTLQMQPSMLNDDDLIIKVIDENNQVIATKRISGDDTATGYGMAKKEVTENGMVYTLEDLEISEGVKITLNLSGTQNLNKGVYLYSAKVYTDSQTFVGVSEGTREVDLSVGISFTTEAAKGAIAHTTASTTQTKTDTKTETKTDVTTESQTVTKETTEKTVADVTNTATKVYADVTVTSVETTSNTTDKTWESTTEKTYEVPSPTPTTPSYPTPSPSTTPTPSVTPSTTPSTTPESTPETVVEVPDEDVPLGEMVEFEDPEDAEEVILDGEVPLAQLPDSEVPLSDVPVTGDTVMVWSVLFIFSCSIVLAMGLCAVVTQCDRKKKHTHNHK